MNFKEKYIKFCQTEPIPIFSQPWWLDAVCGKDNWNVIIIEKGGVSIASFPYYMYVGKLGLKHITMPILTQKLGPYIKYPKNQTLASKLSYEKEILNNIISQLPKHDDFNVNFDYKYTNWLPFYWNNFFQTTKYTYIINSLINSDIVFSRFHGNKKTDIRKAISKVIIKYDLPYNEFLKYYCNSLSKFNQRLSYPENIFINLYKASYVNNSGRVIYAIDSNNNIHGAIFYVWDSESIYSLVTAFDPDYRNTAASSLLFYQIMKDFSTSGLKFDFEGSMCEPIENSYNKFGTIQTPYFNIRKYNTKKSKLLHTLKDIVNAVKN